MPPAWEFTQSILTTLNRSRAWEFLSDIRNHAAMEGVTVELDGPFATGTKGRTISAESQQEWILSDVQHEQRLVITGRNGEVDLSFAWELADEGSGTRLTQRIFADGPEKEIDNWNEALRQLADNAEARKEEIVTAMESWNG